MSNENDLRAALELALLRAERAEERLLALENDRDRLADTAARVDQAEASAAAQAKLVAALTSTEDPLSPMAAVAKLSAQRDALATQLETERSELTASLEASRNLVVLVLDDLAAEARELRALQEKLAALTQPEE